MSRPVGSMSFVIYSLVLAPRTEQQRRFNRFRSLGWLLMSQPAGSRFIVIYSLVLAHRAEQQGKHNFYDSIDVRRRPL